MNPIDQRNKNQDKRAALPPPINQREKKKQNSLEIAKEKEEQEKVRALEKEEEGAEEAGEEEGRGPQAATGKNQRGKYRQYEDSQVIIEKIRSCRTQRYPDSEIMKLLDNMPRRTYYNYVKKLQQQDMQIMEQWMKENVEHVSEELIIHRETLCQKLRELQGIVDNKNTPPKDKIRAIEQYLTISEKLSNFTKIGRSSNMKS